MQAQAAYDELVRRRREETLLASCAELLAWDEDTYMPRGGAALRGNQMALLAGLHHERATSPRVGALLAELEASDLLNDPLAAAAVNVRELRRAYRRLTRLPRTLVEEMARVTSLAQQEWGIARQESEFTRFRPWLEKIVALKLQEAECLGYDAVPYDALLEEYEPGVRTADVAMLFDALRRELVPMVKALTHAPRRPETGLLRRRYPLDRQQVFGELVAATLGFDFHAGRLDTTTHPFFARIGPGDCRITTRYTLDNLSDGLFGILHELGHALYEQGLDPEHYGTPMGEAVSLGMHESQARLWENTVGRSLAFWRYFFPLARRIFHETLPEVSLEAFHFAVNDVEPSFIRVQADEVTYNLHILIRFELELALLHGDLRPGDVPQAWNEAYQHYLGITPPDDATGCLQDGHWAGGLIGYYPTYTLGNLFAAQLFGQASAELGDLEEAFTRGDFTILFGWLREKVYRQGHRYPAARLIEHITGAPPDHRPFVHALWHKYGGLYEVALPHGTGSFA